MTLGTLVTSVLQGKLGMIEPSFVLGTEFCHIAVAVGTSLSLSQFSLDRTLGVPLMGPLYLAVSSVIIEVNEEEPDLFEEQAPKTLESVGMTDSQIGQVEEN